MAKNLPSLKALAENKTDGVQKTTQFQVDPRIIEVEDGFNARPIDRDHVESMKAAKKAGATFPPVFVRVDNGRIIMVDGHHRLAADMELIAEGIDVKRIDCMQFRGNDAERIALILTTAQGKPLTPLEAGLQYKKLMALGWSVIEIAAKVGRTRQHVDDMIRLANAPSEMHKMIRDKKIAANTALSVVRSHGENATKVIKDAQNKSAASGKNKTTKKDLGITPAKTWFLLFDGNSPDGRGQPVFVCRTTDKAKARKHYQRCNDDQYSTGDVRIATDYSYEIAGVQTNWDAL